MTACVDNNQKKGRTAKAVSATLAGVLAVGMVPAAAFADTAVETEASDDAALLADGSDVIAGAVATDAMFANGAAIDDPSNIDIYKGDLTELQNIDLHTIQFGSTILTDLGDHANVTFTFKGYAATADFNSHPNYGDSGQYGAQSLSALTGFGIGQKFFAAYEISSNDPSYDGKYFYLPFELVGKSLDGAYLIENGNIEDSTFTWTGNAFTLGVAVNDTIIDWTNYNVSIYADGKTETPLNDMWGEVLTPGGYTAIITGAAGTDYEGAKAEYHFTVDKLDLSQVTAFVKADAFSGNDTPDTTAAEAALTAMYINGSPINLAGFDLSYVSGPSGVGTVAELGAYTYEIVPDSTIAANCVANTSKEVTINKVDTFVGAGEFYYGTTWFGDADFTTNYNSNNPNLFDENDVHVYDGTGTAISDELPFTLKVYDQYYNPATIDDLKTSGTWRVFASVDSAATDYKFGGMSNELTVTVINADIAEANVVYAYDGQNMSTDDAESYEVTYDGTDQLSHITTQVKDKNGNVLTAGEDYQLVVKDETGTIVTEIVNAGTYTLDVTSDKYNFVGDHDAKLIVNPAPIKSIDVTNMMSFGWREFYDYTGEAFTPEIEYATTSNPTASDYKPLPDVYDMEIFYTTESDIFNANGDLAGSVTEYQKVDEIKEVGSYIIVLHPDEQAEGVDNFLFTEYAPLEDSYGNTVATLPWTYAYVSDQGVYSDVPSDHWAAQYIYTASEEGYVNGYAGTNYFGPNNEILRGEAATILFRMAGGNEISSSILQQILAQPMPFSDVESGMYYTAPIIWASSAHIVNGYDSTGLFAPNGDITREEFATMLYRYAKATDQLGNAEAGDLSNYVDGASVSDWAKEAMEWATGAGIMNGYGDTGVLGPQNTITRAEACKMMVELQPETLTNMFNSPVLP